MRLTLLAMLVSTACVPPPPDMEPPTPQCTVTSIEKLPTNYENYVVHPATGLVVVSKPDDTGVYQIYTGIGEQNLRCITCTAVAGGPRVDRHKMMVSIHPSGKWISLGIEEDTHDLMWLPESWQIGLLQSGVWLNIWMTTPTGDRWYQMTDYNPTNGPANGFVGVGFINGGTTAMWTEIVDGNVLVNKFGVWRLLTADFAVVDGTPTFRNKLDITPANAKWIEPGNMHPDGRHLAISTDIGLTDAQGQDQWSLDVVNGDLEQLTNTPTVWDEHGLYSPDGKKLVFMSSYPYQSDPSSDQTFSLRTEFMMMNADGTGLQQLTHFNVPGYSESQTGNTVAAVAGFTDDGTHLMATVMAPEFGKTNWRIDFAGPCGLEASGH